MDVNMDGEFSPVFVGGTGRSGTTIVGQYLNSHRSLVTPVHENKLIVEKGGLRSLVDTLSKGYDYKENHYAISDFIDWANTLRKYGFQNKTADFLHRGVNKAVHFTIGKKIPAAQVCRALPFCDFSFLSIGTNYGLSHYDHCIDHFLANVIGETDAHGIVDTEGLIKPVYLASTSRREDLLKHSRDFLASLNKLKMQDAGAQRWCDDTPLNGRYADFLLDLYPTGKVIHVVRDPHDVVASYSEKPWASSNLNFITSRLKRQYSELIKAEESLPKESFMTFRLEDFANEHDKQKEELCAFLDLDPDGFDGSVTFNASSFGRWRKKFSSSQAKVIESELSEVRAQFGYTS